MRPWEPSETAYAVALASLDSLGPTRFAALTSALLPSEAWDCLRHGGGRFPLDVAAALSEARTSRKLLDRWSSAARRIDPHELLTQCAAAGVGVVTRGEAGYPARLLEDPQPPAVLFFLGSLRSIQEPLVAIVGTRRATPYGRAVAHELGEVLASCGVTVVSGLASGIDAAAHRGALRHAALAPPVGVVATGPDVVYPPRNRDLWEHVAEVGLLFGETPPGVRPQRWRFPSRNRLVATLAHVVVVVESHERGGALITAELALERQRQVAAVPGSIRSPASRGTNRLLSEGAHVVSDVADVVGLVGNCAQSVGLDVGDAAPAGPSSHDERRVLDALGWEPATSDDVVERSRLPLVTVTVLLDRLEARRVIARDANRFHQL